jgi:Phasin protein
MFDTFFDTKGVLDFATKSFAPFARFAELSASSFEKVARFQVDSAVDLVNHASARVQATLAAIGSPYQFAARHSELTADFIAKRNQKWQDYLKFTSEFQADVSKWADDAKTQMTTQFTPQRQAA